MALHLLVCLLMLFFFGLTGLALDVFLLLTLTHVSHCFLFVYLQD